MANISKPVGNNEQYAYNSFNDDHEEKVKAIMRADGRLKLRGMLFEPGSKEPLFRDSVESFDDPRNSTVMRARLIVNRWFSDQLKHGRVLSETRAECYKDALVMKQSLLTK